MSSFYPSLKYISKYQNLANRIPEDLIRLVV